MEKRLKILQLEANFEKNKKLSTNLSAQPMVLFYVLVSREASVVQNVEQSQQRSAASQALWAQIQVLI